MLADGDFDPLATVLVDGDLNPFATMLAGGDLDPLAGGDSDLLAALCGDMDRLADVREAAEPLGVGPAFGFGRAPGLLKRPRSGQEKSSGQPKRARALCVVGGACHVR